VWLEFGSVGVGLEEGKLKSIARGQSELGVALRGGNVALVMLRVGGEGVGVVVGHGGSEREAWETPTCENFHKSGAAAGNSLWLCVEKPGNGCFGIKHIPKLCFELLI
jgi:hypothetical protein